MREQRSSQVVLRLGPGLRHPLPSEHRRSLSERLLGFDRVARVAEHLGPVDVADRGEDGRDIHERDSGGGHVPHGGDEIALEQRYVPLVVQRLGLGDRSSDRTEDLRGAGGVARRQRAGGAGAC